MPNMDGLTAAAEIKQNMATVCLLVLSGAPVETAVLDALDKGVTGITAVNHSPIHKFSN